jgi:alpha-glucosidase
MGIWWSVHLGFETFEAGPHHAATTAKTRQMIDACARLGVDALLIEGWNKGWEYRGKRDDIPDFTAPTDDYDLPALARYAKKRGVQLIIHHETFGNIAHYEKHMKAAFDYCRSLGITMVKGGYAGSIKPANQLRQGQYMLGHYRRQIEQAAAQGIILDIHEPAKFVGFGRTYPNLMTGEAVRGLEWEAWSAGNPPSHTVTIPFTRGLAGPIDYNVGIFDIKFEQLKNKNHNWRATRATYPKKPGPCVQTTLAKQLALFVIIYSPMQMLPDLPENYEGHPAFKFLQDAPVDWAATRVLNGEVGTHITIARKDKNSGAWFVGSATDEDARTLDTPLSFLDAGRTYLATIYADATDAHWDTNPRACEISTRRVTRDTVLTLKLAPGGGQAISLVPLP